MAETVGFIGLGAMGAEMARNLQRAGYHLRVWNRSSARAEAFAGQIAGQNAGPIAGQEAVACATPAEVTDGASAVVSMVADDTATRSVMLGPDGVITRGPKGLLVVDCSTNTPGIVREVAAAAAARGIDCLDAPVSGSIAQASGRELVFMVGGETAACERAAPLFAAMGRLSRHMGPSGSGATIKLINNMLSGTTSAALAEMIAVAEAAGLDPEATLAILGEGAAGSRLVRSKIPKMTGRDFTPQFQLGLMEKDLRYFLALAQDLDRPAPIAALVRSQYQAARLADLGKLDVAAMFLHATGRKP